jgi:gliding motility-associated-like protein
LKEKVNIEKLFADKMKDLKPMVDPKAWSAVNSGLMNSIAVKSGFTILTKTIIGLSAASFISIATYFVFKDSNIEKKTAIIKKVDPKISEVVINDSSVDNITADKEPNKPQEIKEKDVILPLNEFIYPKEHLSQEDEPLILKERTEPFIKIEEEVEKTIIAKEEQKSTVIIEETTQNATATNFVFPNVFTPNNDGDNDLFFMLEEASMNECTAFIYGPKGNVVFKTNNLNFKWNGITESNNSAEPGNYLLVIIGSDGKGNPIRYTKKFRLIK